MPNISVSFRNRYDQRTRWVIMDMARVVDGITVEAFAGDLDPDQSTGPLTFFNDEGRPGSVEYQRTDGPLIVAYVSDGEEVGML